MQNNNLTQHKKFLRFIDHTIFILNWWAYEDRITHVKAEEKQLPCLTADADADADHSCFIFSFAINSFFKCVRMVGILNFIFIIEVGKKEKRKPRNFHPRRDSQYIIIIIRKCRSTWKWNGRKRGKTKKVNEKIFVCFAAVEVSLS